MAEPLAQSYLSEGASWPYRQAVVIFGEMKKSFANYEYFVDMPTLQMLVALLDDSSKPSLHVNKLLKFSGVSNTSALRRLDRLERGGVIERQEDPTDRRANSVTLTTAGRSALVKIADSIISSVKA